MDTKYLSDKLNVDRDFIIREVNFSNKDNIYPKKLKMSDLMTWTIMPQTHQNYSNFWLFVTIINILSNIYIWILV